MKKIILLLLLAIGFSGQALPPRPPQFVLMAFDGSLNLSFWNESRQFAKGLSSQGHPLNFTYFISGVYFLNDAVKSEYDAPHHGIGKSEIGFGGAVSTIAPRVEQVNLAYEEGHEIGSHANGHFDAGIEKWNLSEWTSELTQFLHLIFDAISINHTRPIRPTSNGYIFSKDEVIGFRAPQLGITPDMFTALAHFNYKYDTSRTNTPTYWPAKNTHGTWNFPLADLIIAGTAKKTLSMDYNFYVSQSGANPDPANKALYKKQMMDTYLTYFQNNYNGKRAPIHIGHHFSKWNGGAYWEAMQEFATQVCGLPEVHCVTYKAYMNWLESLDATTYQNYKDGNFDVTDRPIRLAPVTPTKNVRVKISQDSRGWIMTVLSVPNKKERAQYSVQMIVDGNIVAGNLLPEQDLANLVEPGSEIKITAQVIDKNTGIEIQRATQTLHHAATDEQWLDPQIFEDRAGLGDLPEAHREE